ncbi:hypothetical protein EST38_g3351 [Candolleomyces aberdarensis]|uniref:Uncharacterized protein n=1 Tax=Candolleomyces aberdarensis TaxID=2316362 RepID=A0A4Q2DS88_9AGAR|nr:hypothetical protein EST38_g3351 [Candolleomyces aberdarensis]
MPSLSNLTAGARQSGRGSKRIRNDASINFAQALKEANKTVEEHSKTKATIQKYDCYYKQAVKFVREFANDEASKEAARKEHQAKLGQPDDDIDDSRYQEDPLTCMPPDFDTAFDGPPKPFTPLAIAMFLSEKCVKQNCKVGVAYAIYSSMLNHYENLDGIGNDKYRGDWVCDEKTGTCGGNPAKSGQVQRMLHSIKKKDAEVVGERKHARAMSYEDMGKMHAHAEATCPSAEACERFKHCGNGYYEPLFPELLSKRAEHLYYSAYSTLSFAIWTRCHETCQLQKKHFDFNMPPKCCSNGEVHERFSVNLRHRKNWQNKMESGELGVEGHYYNIYSRPDEPAVDAYHHVHEWVRFYSDVILRRPLKDSDYIFPTINFSKLTANPEKPSDSVAMQKIITRVADASGLSNSEACKYTTHCFRRGGAQYRFMFAPLGKRWTLARIRWWAGWAEGEHGDTLIRYLLDELSNYEEDHRDALCPVDEAANKSHLGEDRALRPFTAEDGKQFFKHCDRLLETQFQNLTNRLIEAVESQNSKSASACQPLVQAAHAHPNHTTHAAGPIRTLQQHPDSAPYPAPAPWAIPVQRSLLHVQPSPNASTPYYYVSLPSQRHPHHCEAANLAAVTPSAPLPTIHWQPPAVCPQISEPLLPPQERHTLPRISKKDPHLQWKTVVNDWECPQPERCPIPLRSWDPDWYKETKQAMMYHVRKTIAEEYIIRYNRDDARFLEDYPEHTRGITPLFSAIQANHIKLGLARPRAKRNGARK